MVFYFVELKVDDKINNIFWGKTDWAWIAS